MVKQINSIFVFCILIVLYILTMFIVNIISKPKDCTVKYGRFWLWNILFSILLAVITFILFTYIFPNNQFENFGKYNRQNYTTLESMNHTRRFDVANFSNPFKGATPLDTSKGYDCNVAGVSQNKNIPQTCRGATLNSVINGTANSTCCPQYSSGRGHLNPYRAPSYIEKEFGPGKPDLYPYETLKASCSWLNYEQPPPQYSLNPATCTVNGDGDDCGGQSFIRENFNMNPRIIDNVDDVDHNDKQNSQKKQHKLVKLLTKKLCGWCDRAKKQLEENTDSELYNNIEIVLLNPEDKIAVPSYIMDGTEIQVGYNENFNELCEKFKGNINIVEGFKKQSELHYENELETELETELENESETHSKSHSKSPQSNCENKEGCKINVKNDPLNFLKGRQCCNNYYNISEYLNPAENIVFSMAGSTVDIYNPNGYFCKENVDCGNGKIFTN